MSARRSASATAGVDPSYPFLETSPALPPAVASLPLPSDRGCLLQPRQVLPRIAVPVQPMGRGRSLGTDVSTQPLSERIGSPSASLLLELQCALLAAGIIKHRHELAVRRRRRAA
jgi:hypothetical protein